MHFSHNTVPETQSLDSPVTQIRAGTQEHSSTFPFGEPPFFFYRNLGPEAGTMWLHIGNFSENWSWIYLPDPRRLKTFNQYIVKEERIPKFFFYSLTTVNHPPWMSMPDSSLHIMEKVKLHSRKTDKFRLDVHCWTHMDLMILRVFFDLSNSIIL